jgi:hypothetical protein
LWETILSFAVTYSFFFTQTRYCIPIEPYITILSAYGIKTPWDLVAERFACKGQVEAKVEVGLKAFEIRRSRLNLNLTIVNALPRECQVAEKSVSEHGTG